jgi:hypothetical protein
MHVHIKSAFITTRAKKQHIVVKIAGVHVEGRGSTQSQILTGRHLTNTNLKLMLMVYLE